MIKKIRLAIRNDLEATEEERQFGTGWLSGLAALILSVSSLFLLISQRYPEWLSMKELSVIYHQQYFTLAIQLMLVIAFVLVVINLTLRRNKILGFTSMIIVLISLLVGQLLPENSEYKANAMALGLDWFVLNLIFHGILFIPLEKLFGRLTDQPLFRMDWKEDLFYFLVGSLLVQIFAFLSMSPSMMIVENTSSWGHFRQWVANQPIALQVLEIMLLTDLFQYWFHRLFHEIPFLWRFHAVHHSTTKMDWLASSRMHVFEIVGLRAVTIIPMFTLGFNQESLSVYILIVLVYASYIHSNVKFDIEWLKPVIVTPRFHHWHHGIEKEAINVNYAIHFSWLDKLFGTYYMPPNKWPSGYGVGGNPVPKGYVKQFLYPFQKKKKK
jgi:sterol desaturase/sphingolipid hydroxylase (fatty acid hydroxylase superfamily)